MCIYTHKHTHICTVHIHIYKHVHTLMGAHICTHLFADMLIWMLTLTLSLASGYREQLPFVSNGQVHRGLHTGDSTSQILRISSLCSLLSGKTEVSTNPDRTTKLGRSNRGPHRSPRRGSRSHTPEDRGQWRRQRICIATTGEIT